MHNTRLHTTPKTTKKPRSGQPVRAYLLLLSLVLFTLSSCISTPNTAQAPALAIATTLPIGGQSLVFQVTALRLAKATDAGCSSDTVYVEQISLQELSIYFNDCALQHLSAIVADANALTAFITLICPECEPVASWLTAITAAITANIQNLVYASKQCGGSGAILSISWSEGWQFKPVCQDQ